MEFIRLNEKSIESENICCAISDKKSFDGVDNKKQWLKRQFKNGYVFNKLNVRGKVFIEYIPIKYSWLPLDGKNFMVINCFWVSGQFKSKGYGRELLNQAILDAKLAKMDGIIAITGDKKKPFMSDPKFFEYNGFTVIDYAPPFFKLWGLKFNIDDHKIEYPKIMASAKKGECENRNGIVAYYSYACPFSDHYINNQLRNFAKSKNIAITIYHINSQQYAHKMPIPWVINSVFFNGKLVTLEMKAERHLIKAMDRS